MTTWLTFAGAVSLLGLWAALVAAARGDAVARLAGLQFGGSCTVLVLVALAAATGQSSALVVPLALVLLTFAGTLVYTRLLGGD